MIKRTTLLRGLGTSALALSGASPLRARADVPAGKPLLIAVPYNQVADMRFLRGK